MAIVYKREERDIIRYVAEVNYKDELRTQKSELSKIYKVAE
jgi:hypothetical protein